MGFMRQALLLLQQHGRRLRMWRFWLAVVLSEICSPLLPEARLGEGVVELTNATFDDFVSKNSKVLVDFYTRDDENLGSLEAELKYGMLQFRSFGCKAAVGKVNVKGHPDLEKRFVPAGGRLPQLLWFLHGHATQYHRNLRNAKSISDFVMALDRDPIAVVTSDEQVKNYNRAVLAHTASGSPLFKTLQVVASQHLDTIAFLVRPPPPGSKDNISYVTDGEGAAPVLYTGETTVPAIESWVRSLLMKSEEPPTDEPQEGEALVVVGKTFEKLVLRKDKDVLILIYAPWCGHSRKVAPAWEVLARAVTQESHLVVAKVDGDRNSSPLPELFTWDAYPMIFFFAAGNRTPAIFHGNRTVANFVHFVNDHGTAPFTVDDAIMQADPDSLSGLGEL